MIYLAYFVVVFSSAQLLVSFANFVFYQRFVKEETSFNGFVSVLVPARNEEKNIGNILDDLLNQDYSHIEIIVFNDLSTDRTAEIVNEKATADKRIRLINSDGLPDGWLGKNHACHTLSCNAKGTYYLFLDADVRIGRDLIQNSVHFAEKHQLGLLSIFPKQIMLSVGEKITVPNMNFILLSLLPLLLVRKSKYPSLSAANGQFMLFNASIYQKMTPHETMKSNMVEDIEIAQYYKRNHIAIACLAGNDSLTCRMYDGFNQAVNGFSKNVAMFFGGSFTIATMFWLITTFGLLAVLLILSFNWVLLYTATILITRVFISIISKQSVISNIILLIPQQIILGFIIYKAFVSRIKKQYRWKDRNIT